MAALRAACCELTRCTAICRGVTREAGQLLQPERCPMCRAAPAHPAPAGPSALPTTSGSSLLLHRGGSLGVNPLILIGSRISGPSETSTSIPSPKMEFLARCRGTGTHSTSLGMFSSPPAFLHKQTALCAWPVCLSWKTITVCMGLRSKLPRGADY